MVDKIKEWLFLKYNIEAESRHIWMVLILAVSLVVLVLVLLTNKSSRPKAVPANYNPINAGKL